MRRLIASSGTDAEDAADAADAADAEVAPDAHAINRNAGDNR
jgi:hypothetical protein